MNKNKIFCFLFTIKNYSNHYSNANKNRWEQTILTSRNLIKKRVFSSLTRADEAKRSDSSKEVKDMMIADAIRKAQGAQ